MNILIKALRYYHTLKYLRLEQILWRLKYRFCKNNKVSQSPAPPIRQENGIWKRPAARKPSMTAKNKFWFLNQEGKVNSPDDWQHQNTKLWLYNLHYFDDLNAINSTERNNWHISIIDQWINENPPLYGEGWEPYPLSLRAINWIKWGLSSEGYLSSKAIDSLAIQIRWLTQRIEWHLLGNHLFINAKALVFAGCFFHGEEAESWLNKGMTILKREIPEQILNDGGHFERSTMYHALTLEDLLDLYNLSNRFPLAFNKWIDEISHWLEIIQKMGCWLKAMSHPDGEISFFNDAAIGIAPAPSEIFRYAKDLSIICPDINSEEIIWLKESGYVRISKENLSLIIDLAPIGTDYLPGHAHADTLSYELSINGKRIIVNSGTSRYGLGPEREWERSTAAHSTVEVNEENSSEVWSGFRVARRAYPLNAQVSSDNNEITVSCSHNGYYRLAGRNIHNRIWKITDNQIIVNDQISGKYSSAISRIYFSPGIIPQNDGIEGSFLISSDGINMSVKGGATSLLNTKYFPEFGLQKDNFCLKTNIESTMLQFKLDFFSSNHLNSTEEL